MRFDEERVLIGDTQIGRVTAWDPGRRLAFESWTWSFRANERTEVEVSFAAVGNGTRVTVQHRGWDSRGARDGEFRTVVALWWGTLLNALKHFFGPLEFGLFLKILELSSRALEACTKRILLEQRSTILEKDFLARHNFQGIVTQDPGFLQVLETVARVASSEMPVLVQGPSGSGKELIARALHLNGPRAKRAIACHVSVSGITGLPQSRPWENDQSGYYGAALVALAELADVLGHPVPTG